MSYVSLCVLIQKLDCHVRIIMKIVFELVTVVEVSCPTQRGGSCGGSVCVCIDGQVWLC